MVLVQWLVVTGRQQSTTRKSNISEQTCPYGTGLIGFSSPDFDSPTDQNRQPEGCRAVATEGSEASSDAPSIPGTAKPDITSPGQPDQTESLSLIQHNQALRLSHFTHGTHFGMPNRYVN